MLLQEIILLECDLDIISQISDQINIIARPSRKAHSNTFDGRPSGGSAIIWSKSLNIDISLKVSCENYLLSELSFNDVKIVLVNMYMPYDNRSNEVKIEYQQILGDLEAAIDSLNNRNILCVGDFNADPNRGRLWPFLNYFIVSNNFTVCDLVLPIDSFTFLSAAHNTTGWLDHIVASKQMNISNVNVLYDVSIYDHFPISFDLCINSCSNISYQMQPNSA